MRTPRSILMLLVAVAASAGCDKNAVQLIAGPPTGGASVKFFNFAVGSPNVNFYINNTKTTGVAATGCYILTDANREACTTTGLEATTGVAYGGAGNGGSGWYSDLPPGQITIQGKIAAAADKDLAIANLQTNIAAGKFYSYYLSGIYDATAKTADSFIVEDPIPAPVDYSSAYVRFVHAMGNANPMTLYATNRTTSEVKAVGAEIAYKAAGQFTAVAPGAYDLGTRYAGASTNAISRTNVTFNAGRVYTITARGNINTSSTILLDNTANQ